jgi:hypothetical protein
MARMRAAAEVEAKLQSDPVAAELGAREAEAAARVKSVVEEASRARAKARSATRRQAEAEEKARSAAEAEEKARTKVERDAEVRARVEADVAIREAARAKAAAKARDAARAASQEPDATSVARQKAAQAGVGLSIAGQVMLLKDDVDQRSRWKAGQRVGQYMEAQRQSRLAEAVDLEAERDERTRHMAVKAPTPREFGPANGSHPYTSVRSSDVNERERQRPQSPRPTAQGNLYLVSSMFGGGGPGSDHHERRGDEEGAPNEYDSIIKGLRRLAKD